MPAPQGNPDGPLQCLIFDSVFNSFRGIIAYFKVVNGSIKKGDLVKFFNTEKQYDADEIGVLRLDMEPRKELTTGDVGYIISGIKTSKEVKVGDTITHVKGGCDKAIGGFEDVKPMVVITSYSIHYTKLYDFPWPHVNLHNHQNRSDKHLQTPSVSHPQILQSLYHSHLLLV